MRAQSDTGNNESSRHLAANLCGGTAMAFVNEYIPKEDLERYNFAELSKRRKKGGYENSQWTVDRDAETWIWCYYIESDHTELDGGFTGVSGWHYCWRGTMLFFEVKSTGFRGGGTREPTWQAKKLLSLEIPKEIETYRPQIITDLIEAFTAYRGAGVLADNLDQPYTFTLEL